MGVDQLEFQLRGLADQRLELARIADAGHFDEDAIAALARDRRLLGAERVDALADDVGGTLHRLIHELVDAALGRRHDDARRIDHADIPVAGAGRADRRGQRADLLHRRVDLSGIAHEEAQGAVGGRDIADVDRLRGDPAHLGADRVLHRGEARLGDVGGIRLEQDVAAAGEIEAEIDARRKAEPHLLGGRFGNQARHREQDSDQQRPDDRSDFPARKVEHDPLSPSFSRWRAWSSRAPR